MEIRHKKAYRLDYDSVKATEISIPAEDDNDFTHYVNELIAEVLEDKRSRRYLFPEYDTGIKTIIKQVVNNEFDDGANSAAQRLVKAENEAQKKISQLDQEVQRGILVQALVEKDGQLIYFITKAEHFDFIDEEKKKRATGLPIKKKVFKSFVCYIVNGEPEYAMISDSNQKISAFWVKSFLELLEERDDSYNTKESFDALDYKVFSKIRKEYPEDYMYLRNATVQYFRSKQEFVLEDYVTDLLGDYEPADERLPIDDLQEKIRQLPEKQKFDGRFEIQKGELKKRFIKKINLTPQLVLEIKENIQWESTVQAFEEAGYKYIKIRTEEGYQYFKKAQR